MPLPVFILSLMNRDALVNQDDISADADASTAASTSANGNYGYDMITIKGATSNNNLRDGMSLRGGGIYVEDEGGIYVKDSTTSYNGRVGIRVAGGGLFNPTFVQFEGTVSSHHNGQHGIEVGVGLPLSGPFGGNIYAFVNVKGVVNSYLNGEYGIYVLFIVLVLNVEKRSSLNFCQNDIEDIYIPQAILPVFVITPPESEDSDYFTCDGDDSLVVCTPCPVCN
jgi:hypothetical protein